MGTKLRGKGGTEGEKGGEGGRKREGGRGREGRKGRGRGRGREGDVEMNIKMSIEHHANPWCIGEALTSWHQ